MAHGRFKVLDSDIHIIEPPDLWPRYIDPAFRDRAPIGLTEDEGDLRLAHAGKPWGGSRASTRIGAAAVRGVTTPSTRIAGGRTRSAAGRRRFSSRRWTSRASTSRWSIPRAGSSP